MYSEILTSFRRRAATCWCAALLLTLGAVAQGSGQDPNRVRDLFSFARDGRVGHPHDLQGTAVAAAGDVDGDGHLDIYFAPRANHSFHVGEAKLLLGDGQGGFRDVTATHIPADRNVIGTDVKLGDVDGDGDLDALVFGGFTVVDADIQAMSFLQGFMQYLFTERLYLNDGTGRFALAPAGMLPEVDENTRFGELFDADGDGDLDAYLANAPGAHRHTGWVSDGQNELWINDGSGRFVDETAARLPSDRIDRFGSPLDWGLAIADVDGDGDPDIVSGRQAALVLGITAGDLLVDLNDGNGHFTRVPTLPPAFQNARIRSVTAFDADGDGRDEILATILPDYTYPYSLVMRLLDHDGTGFVDATSRLSVDRLPDFSGAAIRPTPQVALDIDGDGDEDLLLHDREQAILLRNDGAAGVTVVFDVPGGEEIDDISAHERAPFPIKSAGVPDLLAADFDRDGQDEVLVNSLADLKLYDPRPAGPNGLHLEDRWGGLVPAGEELDFDLAFGDIDGDGDLDLVAARQPGTQAPGEERRQTMVYLGDGLGGFEPAPESWNPFVAIGLYPSRSGFDLCDVDGDLDLDLIGHLSYQGGGLHLWRNDGSGNFGNATPEVLAPFQDRARQCLPFDADGDGDLDLLVIDDQKQGVVPPRLFLNDGSGVFHAAPASVLPAPLGTLVHATVGDVDADGDADLVLAGHPTDDGLTSSGSAQTMLWRNDGSGRFSDSTADLPLDDVPTYSTTLADVDADGDLDLLLANYGFSAADAGWQQIAAPSNALWLNDGSGRFGDVSATALPPNAHHTGRFLVSDFDGDGDIDLYLVGEHESHWEVASWWRVPALTRDSYGNAGTHTPLPDLLWLNDGRGRFVEAADALPTQGIYKRDAQVLDLDGDGDEDVVLLARAPVNRLLPVWNRAQHLQMTVPPTVGRTARLTPWHVSADIATGGAGLIIGTRRADLVVPGAGWLRIDPLTLGVGFGVPFRPGAGQPTMAVPIPAEPSLAGVTVIFQAVLLDVGGATLSNAIQTWIGG